MSDKTASVHWVGSAQKGQGQISTETQALQKYPYGFGSRFENDRSGTNPEELLAAAHAACFAMAFSFACAKAGFETTTVNTQAKVGLKLDGGGFVIDHIHLILEAVVPNLDETKFQEIAQAAKKDCPLSKALASVSSITLEAKLNK